jgi:hypothetical protein
MKENYFLKVIKFYIIILLYNFQFKFNKLLDKLNKNYLISYFRNKLKL